MMTGAQQVGLATIRSVLTRVDALTAVRRALHELADGGAVAPPGLGLRTHHGEIHIKGAAFLGSRVLVVKVATGFPGNAPLDLPVNDGFSMVFDARTGACLAVLDDGGWQTEIRTAAAGALAAQLLAREDATVAAVLGAGAQARFQIEALADVRRLDRVHVWARRQDQSRQYAVEMRKRLSVEVVVARTVQEAVEVAEILVTTTSSRTPLVRAAWLKPGAHVTAMGSDFPGKQELCTDVLGRADLVVADSLRDCAESGELQHALAAGVVRHDQIVELAEVLSGKADGRTDAQQITVADQCGLGVYDAAVAELVMSRLGRSSPESESS